jgi:hypothetical protein
MHICNFIQKNKNEFEPENDTLFGQNLWIEPRDMKKILTVFTSKKIEYISIDNVDSTKNYKNVLTYNPDNVKKFELKRRIEPAM